MFKYIVIFALFSPLIGIYQVEKGEYAYSVGKDGFHNGAFFAYGTYATIVLIVSFLISFRKKRGIVERNKINVGNQNSTSKIFVNFSIKLFVLHSILLIVMLFIFNGYKVWLGIIDKGQFRTELGSFGAIPFMMSKFCSPTLFAYSTLLFINSKKSFDCNFWFGVNIILILLLGSTWGFKTAGMSMLLPGLLILYWKVSFTTIVKLFVSFFCLALLFFYWFDSAGDGLSKDAVIFIFDRLTILQGDVSWHIWGLYQSGEKFSNYFPTLLAAFGDSTLKIFGVDNTNLYNWMEFHYDWMLNYWAGIPLEHVKEGHNVVGTPFSEGLIAGGYYGMILFAIIGGTLIGLSYRFLSKYIHQFKKTNAALLSTFFCFNIFSWLSGGSITQLFHISNIIGFLFTLFVIEIMNQFQFKNNLYQSKTIN